MIHIKELTPYKIGQVYKNIDTNINVSDAVLEIDKNDKLVQSPYWN